jgi:hypothetical protein
LAFFRDIIHLARPDKLKWKANEWNNGTEFVPRNRGKVIPQSRIE